MRKDNSKKMRIVIEKGEVISRKQLFKDKEKFHNEQAKLPFEEKVKIIKLKVSKEYKGTL